MQLGGGVFKAPWSFWGGRPYWEVAELHALGDHALWLSSACSPSVCILTFPAQWPSESPPKCGLWLLSPVLVLYCFGEHR